MYYEITTKVVRTQEDGTKKEVAERYLADCETFTEAEKMGAETYADYSLDGDVVAVKRSNVKEIVNEDEEKEHYFKATIIDTFTADNGKEKELRYYVLIRANDLGEATAKANEYMRQGLQDMRLDGIVKTKILELLR